MKVEIQTRIINEQELVESESENLDSEVEINNNCGGKVHFSQVSVTLWIHNEAESINTLQLHMIEYLELLSVIRFTQFQMQAQED